MDVFKGSRVERRRRVRRVRSSAITQFYVPPISAAVDPVDLVPWPGGWEGG